MLMNLIFMIIHFLTNMDKYTHNKTKCQKNGSSHDTTF